MLGHVFLRDPSISFSFPYLPLSKFSHGKLALSLLGTTFFFRVRFCNKDRSWGTALRSIIVIGGRYGSSNLRILLYLEEGYGHIKCFSVLEKGTPPTNMPSKRDRDAEEPAQDAYGGGGYAEEFKAFVGNISHEADENNTNKFLKKYVSASAK